LGGAAAMLYFGIKQKQASKANARIDTFGPNVGRGLVGVQVGGRF
jgi:hypothetical protein